MTPRCAERVLQLFCYADVCRRRSTWRRMLRSAPVYACTGGCGTTREVHELGRGAAVVARPTERELVRAMRAADFSFDMLDGRRATGWRFEPVAAAPYCGCCHMPWLLVRGVPLKRCACDPSAPTCVRCSRGGCHCRCRRPSVNLPTQDVITASRRTT